MYMVITERSPGTVKNLNAHSSSQEMEESCQVCNHKIPSLKNGTIPATSEPCVSEIKHSVALNCSNCILLGKFHECIDGITSSHLNTVTEVEKCTEMAAEKLKHWAPIFGSLLTGIGEDECEKIKSALSSGAELAEVLINHVVNAHEKLIKDELMQKLQKIDCLQKSIKGALCIEPVNSAEPTETKAAVPVAEVKSDRLSSIQSSFKPLYDYFVDQRSFSITLFFFALSNFLFYLFLYPELHVTVFRATFQKIVPHLKTCIVIMVCVIIGLFIK